MTAMATMSSKSRESVKKKRRGSVDGFFQALSWLVQVGGKVRVEGHALSVHSAQSASGGVYRVSAR